MKKMKRWQQPTGPTEFYDVKLNYMKPDRFWKMGHIEMVAVPITDPKQEKAQHAKAEAIARQRFPGCDIVSVTYD